ncbi:acetate kinase [Magnetovirga frankeli]|uniref:acetate/propionate family kinase n=1 Tax=Magnetovirga frankeli TaxID=947516 RepID=UPI001293081A|nr:acetate kinase [gamma proteobacterium SS-5]
MRILVINSGSSSIKFQLLQMADESLLLAGLLERIGEGEASLHLQLAGAQGQQRSVLAVDHQQGMGLILDALQQARVLSEARPLAAIGHRVVQGGEHFRAPCLLDGASIERIRACIPLAPLHNPANLAGIQACRALFPDLPQIAVFDTAFHQGMPESAWRYAVPDDWYRNHGVRRYGFHGSSHAYVAKRAADWLGRPLERCNLISLHLGNGASMAAIRAGRCEDTSMGMTPLEGLVMGSRSGDLDPAIPAYLNRVAGLSAEAIDAALNRDSGLKALCGENDMRRILQRAEADDPKAELALEIYCRRIRKYLGGYLALLGRVDALIFTGGIGEHAAPIRQRICADLDGLGIQLDLAANQAVNGEIAPIHRPGSRPLLVIRTNEELEIARQCKALIAKVEPEKRI